ncbi:TIGR01777 family oxidoreductase [Shewanella yunxiaonensis]|uniref:TIGR01777 family oxidoreductase n=1 Tax=Shewanella yunxiaonensis TaxID=2829809 RepID=A0ABX7YWU3_9GAMM|nr:TIGR01777 family oxidoreductase [Shewanella yunxiaonensis]QUN07147.1 TIGR01777 family oxidoreductase [Shewanella yunxiaonensis]
MKILITGATGLVGTALVANLETEHQLVIVSRNPLVARQKLGIHHEYLPSLDGLTDLNGIDAVINLAGEPIVGKRWSEMQKQVICRSRWDITSRLASLIKASTTPPSCFISGSAIGYYGGQDETLLDEDATPVEEFSHYICAEWERRALIAQSSNTRVCIIRTGVVLAANGGALAKMLPAFRLGLGGPIANGRQGMSWIHLSDLVELILFLLSHKQAHGIYNATAPYPVSNAEFARSLGKVLQRPAILPAPAFMLKLLFGEMAELLIEGQYVIPSKAMNEGFRFQFPKLEQALADLF